MIINNAHNIVPSMPALSTILCLLQANNNGEIGIAQNHCSGNTISGNSISANALEGITADNLSDRSQVAVQWQDNII